jgi:ABC-type sugar transport system permease subunit
MLINFIGISPIKEKIHLIEKLKKHKLTIFFLMPTIIIFAAFTFYPVVETIILSFYPIATIANTPIFFKVGDKHCYAPG